MRKLSRENFGIIYLTEDIAQAIPETVAFYDQQLTPALILIPTHRGTTGPVSYTHLDVYKRQEMKYLHDIMNGAPVSKEFEKLLTGEAALEAIASADACTRSINEDRKVKLSEIMG